MTVTWILSVTASLPDLVMILPGRLAMLTSSSSLLSTLTTASGHLVTLTSASGLLMTQPTAPSFPMMLASAPGLRMTLSSLMRFLMSAPASVRLLTMAPASTRFLMTFPRMLVVSLRPALMLWLSLGLPRIVDSLRLPQMTDGPRGKAPFLCSRVFPAPGGPGNER